MQVNPDLQTVKNAKPGRIIFVLQNNKKRVSSMKYKKVNQMVVI